MAIQKLMDLAKWDGNHTTLLVRKFGQQWKATFLHSDGTWSEDIESGQIESFVKAMIASSAHSAAGSFVLSINCFGQGSAPPPPIGPGPGPGGGDDYLVLQAGAIDVHMQLRGLTEKVQLAHALKSMSPTGGRRADGF